MMAATYKLGEYKISEFDTGALGWEAHFGLSALQQGRCFRKGPILFIGPAESRPNGFLKREFIDHLEPLPTWLKTTYFCRGLEVYHCKTGKRVTKAELQLWMFDRHMDERGRFYGETSGHCSNDIMTGRAAEDVAFRLQRYEIIKKPNGQVVWMTAAGPNIGTGGTCSILAGILFFGPRRGTHFHLIKQHFLVNLRHLPRWDLTEYYCPKLPLYCCKTGRQVQEAQEEEKGRPIVITAMETYAAGKEFKANAESRLWQSDLSGNRVIPGTHWARKGIGSAAASTILTISFLFDYLIGLWKALKRR